MINNTARINISIDYINEDLIHREKNIVKSLSFSIGNPAEDEDAGKALMYQLKLRIKEIDQELQNMRDIHNIYK
jgi:hypothetical protein